MVCRHMETLGVISHFGRFNIYAVSPKCDNRRRSLLDCVLFHCLVDPALWLAQFPSRVHRVIEPVPHESPQSLPQALLGGKDHHQHRDKHFRCKNEARTDRLKFVLVIVLHDSRVCLVVPRNRGWEDDDFGSTLAPRAASGTTRFEHGLGDGSDD